MPLRCDRLSYRYSGKPYDMETGAGGMELHQCRLNAKAKISNIHLCDLHLGEFLRRGVVWAKLQPDGKKHGEYELNQRIAWIEDIEK